MRLHSIIRPLLLIALTWASALGQSTSQRSLELSREILMAGLPWTSQEFIGNVERHVDVDGGVYVSDTLEVNYDYWTHANTPNALHGNYAVSLCSHAQRKAKTLGPFRVRLNGNRAVIQRCSLTDERKGYRYIYYVTFPKLRVFDGEGFHYGMFNLRVKYRNPRHLSVARQIVRSLDFER